MVKRRRMTAKQRKYFGKRKTRTVYKTKIRRKRVIMARHRYYGKKAVGGIKGVIPVAISGVADSVIDPRSPIDGLGSLAVGFLMKNSFALNIGAYKAGYSAGGMIPILGGGSRQGGFL